MEKFFLYNLDMKSCSWGGLADLYLKQERDYQIVYTLVLRLLFCAVIVDVLDKLWQLLTEMGLEMVLSDGLSGGWD